MKHKFGIVIIIIIFAVLSFGFPCINKQINLFASLITLAVLLWYTYDTHRIANQTIESALRPVILRQGKILNWKVNSTSEIHNNGFTLEFSNKKNIAKDINGYIIINYKKYKLLFKNQNTEEDIIEDDQVVGRGHIWFTQWGWLPVDGMIFASYKNDDFENSDQNNQIYIEYQDIESNKYFTKENKDFSQTSGKL